MYCLEKKTEWLLLLSVIILSSGISSYLYLNFFKKILYMPVILLYDFLFYIISYIVLYRKGPEKAYFSLISAIIAVFLSTPVFYLASIYTYDLVRTQIINSVFLNEIYKLSKISLRNILFFLFFLSYIATYIFFKNFSDIFELKYIVEKYKNIISVALEDNISGGDNGLKLKVAGMCIGAAIAFIDSLFGNKFFLFFIPILFFSRISIPISMFVASALFSLLSIRIDVFWGLVAIFAFSLFLFFLSRRLAISISGSVSTPLRLFLSAISVLIFLVVFFIVFEIKAILLLPLYLLLLVVFVLSVFELESNNVLLGILAITVVGYMMANSSNELVGVFAMINLNLNAFYWFFTISILAIQTSVYVTYVQRKLGDYTHDCHLGVIEAFIVLVAALSGGSVIVLNPTFIDFTYLSQIRTVNTSLIGIVYPIFSIVFSVAHFLLTTPLVSEGLIFYGLNPFHPVGVFIGGVFPGPPTMVPSIIAIALKIVDLKLGEKILRKLFSYSIIGLGLGYLLAFVFPP